MNTPPPTNTASTSDVLSAIKNIVLALATAAQNYLNVQGAKNAAAISTPTVIKTSLKPHRIREYHRGRIRYRINLRWCDIVGRYKTSLDHSGSRQEQWRAVCGELASLVWTARCTRNRADCHCELQLMPLLPGKKEVGHNISEMEASGHPKIKQLPQRLTKLASIAHRVVSVHQRRMT